MPRARPTPKQSSAPLARGDRRPVPSCRLLIIADGTAESATGDRRSFDAKLRAAQREVARQCPPR